MTFAILGAVAVASLVGSLHCVGMCGGFVAFYSGEDTSRKVWRAHGAYHGARLISYVTVGTVAGAVGSALDAAGRAFGLSRIAAFAAGAAMVLWALGLIGQQLGARLPAWKFTSGLESLAARALRPLANKPPVARAAVLGLSSTLLPCGFLYAFYVTAAGTGSALGGASVMVVFWAGTVPLLLGLGLGTARLARRARRHVPVLSALVLLCIGLLTVTGRVNVPASVLSSVGSGLAPDTAAPPCHGPGAAR